MVKKEKKGEGKIRRGKKERETFRNRNKGRNGKGNESDKQGKRRKYSYRDGKKESESVQKRKKGRVGKDKKGKEIRVISNEREGNIPAETEGSCG